MEGQGEWEEVSIVPKGANMGWRVLEGSHCFNPANNCPRDGKVDPVHEYDHGGTHSSNLHIMF